MKTAESLYFNQHLPPDLKVSQLTLGSIAYASGLRPLGATNQLMLPRPRW